MARKLLAVFLCVAMSSAAAFAATPADTWPNGTLTWYTGPAGGTIDTNTRALVKEMEPHLGVTIVVINNNVPISQASMMTAPADGQNIGIIMIPDLFTAYNPENTGLYKPSEFQMIANVISEPVAFAVSPKDERFKDVEDIADFIAWCRANPGKNLLCAVGPIGNNHDIALRLLIEMTGVKNLKIINTEGGIANRKATFLGGHVDVYWGSVGDSSQLLNDGTAKVIAVLGEERGRALPDVKTAKECGIDLVYGGHRGVSMHPNVDPVIAQKLADAIEWATKQPGYIKAMEIVGMETNLIKTKEYEKFVKAQDDLFQEVIPLLGWND